MQGFGRTPLAAHSHSPERPADPDVRLKKKESNSRLTFSREYSNLIFQTRSEGQRSQIEADQRSIRPILEELDLTWRPIQGYPSQDPLPAQVYFRVNSSEVGKEMAAPDKEFSNTSDPRCSKKHRKIKATKMEDRRTCVQPLSPKFIADYLDF